MVNSVLKYGLDPNLAFERRMGVVQYRIDRVRRIAGSMRRRTLTDARSGPWLLIVFCRLDPKAQRDSDP
jgi:hypothetical protein